MIPGRALRGGDTLVPTKSETKGRYLSGIKSYLKCGRKASRRTGVPVHEFPIGVIKRWQQEMGRPN